MVVAEIVGELVRTDALGKQKANIAALKHGPLARKGVVALDKGLDGTLEDFREWIRRQTRRPGHLVGLDRRLGHGRRLGLVGLFGNLLHSLGLDSLATTDCRLATTDCRLATIDW